MFSSMHLKILFTSLHLNTSAVEFVSPPFFASFLIFLFEPLYDMVGTWNKENIQRLCLHKLSTPFFTVLVK